MVPKELRPEYHQLVPPPPPSFKNTGRSKYAIPEGATVKVEYESVYPSLPATSGGGSGGGGSGGVVGGVGGAGGAVTTGAGVTTGGLLTTAGCGVAVVAGCEGVGLGEADGDGVGDGVADELALAPAWPTDTPVRPPLSDCSDVSPQEVSSNTPTNAEAPRICRGDNSLDRDTPR